MGPRVTSANNGCQRSLTSTQAWKISKNLAPSRAESRATDLPSWARPPRCTMISAEFTGSRPSRCAVAPRPDTQRPRPRGWQLREGRGRSRSRRPGKPGAGYTWDERVTQSPGRHVYPGGRSAAVTAVMICKTVGSAYVGSNPTPATRSPRSMPLSRNFEGCVRERSEEPLGRRAAE
jgi:hypothetical protein